MIPNSTITIGTDGRSKVVGKEQTDDCHKLSEMAAAAGKVIKDDEKDHTPVHQEVHLKGEA